MIALEPVSAWHADLLASLHAAAFPAPERWDAASISAQFALAGISGRVATWQGDPCGFVLIRVVADESEVLTLAVAPSARRRGIARALLLVAMAAAAGAGAESMVLEVSDGNVAARALYAASGFAPVGRRRAYYADGSDALILRAALPGLRADPDAS